MVPAGLNREEIMTSSYTIRLQAGSSRPVVEDEDVVPVPEECLRAVKTVGCASPRPQLVGARRPPRPHFASDEAPLAVSGLVAEELLLSGHSVQKLVCCQQLLDAREPVLKLPRVGLRVVCPEAAARAPFHVRAAYALHVQLPLENSVGLHFGHSIRQRCCRRPGVGRKIVHFCCPFDLPILVEPADHVQAVTDNAAGKELPAAGRRRSVAPLVSDGVKNGERAAGRVKAAAAAEAEDSE
ncbi:hypothetical protein L7F22_048426 [Adiantum nelumboides]|nr:hypothetical protein [Adiantum nelumboides]